MGRIRMYEHELPFADGRRIGRLWRTTGRLPERLMSELRANIPTPLVPSWWSGPRLVPRTEWTRSPTENVIRETPKKDFSSLAHRDPGKALSLSLTSHYREIDPCLLDTYSKSQYFIDFSRHVKYL